MDSPTDRSSVHDLDLAYQRTLEDVAEDVLLDVFVEQVRPFDARADPASGPPNAEATVQHREAVSESVILARQNVGPERIARVVDGGGAEEAREVGVEADIETVRRWQRDLVARIRIGLVE